jgi:hypothetical protein
MTAEYLALIDEMPPKTNQLELQLEENGPKIIQKQNNVTLIAKFVK